MAILESNWMTKSWPFRASAAVSRVCSFQVDSVVAAEYELEYLLLEGHCYDITTGQPPRGLQFTLGTSASPVIVDTIVMANLVSVLLGLAAASCCSCSQHSHCHPHWGFSSMGLWFVVWLAHHSCLDIHQSHIPHTDVCSLTLPRCAPFPSAAWDILEYL